MMFVGCNSSYAERDIASHACLCPLQLNMTSMFKYVQARARFCLHSMQRILIDTQHRSVAFFFLLLFMHLRLSLSLPAMNIVPIVRTHTHKCMNGSPLCRYLITIMTCLIDFSAIHFDMQVAGSQVRITNCLCVSFGPTTLICAPDMRCVRIVRPSTTGGQREKRPGCLRSVINGHWFS